MSQAPDTEALSREVQAAREARVVPDVVDNVTPRCVLMLLAAQPKVHRA